MGAQGIPLQLSSGLRSYHFSSAQAAALDGICSFGACIQYVLLKLVHRSKTVCVIMMEQHSNLHLACGPIMINQALALTEGLLPLAFQETKTQELLH